MKAILFAAGIAAALAAAPVSAQPKGAVVSGDTIEAMVKVLVVDHKNRTVVVQGPRGNTVELQVPPEAQNFDKVKPGSVFKVRYTEALAVGVGRGEPGKGDKKDMVRAQKGDNPAAVATRVRHISGTVDAIDYKSRYVAMRGPKQNTYAFKVADDVKLEDFKPGDRLTIAYVQALAAEMVPEPTPAPEKKKKGSKKKE